MQAQRANPLWIVHWVLGPQGEGSQGFCGGLHGMMGGSPSYSGRQKHLGLPFTWRQPELGPQGLGLQRSPSGTENRKGHTILDSQFKYIWLNLNSCVSGKNRINLTIEIICLVRGHLLQFVNGFPVIPLGQKQIGLPLSSSHRA
jgi:hypothetical protein